MNKKRRLQHISLWIAIAVLCGNQIIYAHYEYQEHQRLHSQDQQILQSLENQLDADEERLKILQEIVDRFEDLPKIQESVRNR